METQKEESKFDKPLIVYRIRTPKVFDITKKMIKFLIEKNFVEYIYLEKDNLKDINSQILFGNNEKEKYFKSFDVENEDSNLCIIVGGDGTCLWANTIYKGKEKPPFLSFHGGNLGFLAIYYPEQFESIFTEFYTKKMYSFIQRKEIKVCIYEKKEKNTIDDINNFEDYELKETYNALNELIVEKKANMSHIYLFLEKYMLAKVSSDGVICATPTGSTAYSLSAGGPILHNNVEGVILTAICPFSLSFRPIVLPPKTKLRIKNDTSHPNCNPIIKMDGNDKGILQDNQYLEISLSDKSIDFIVLKETEDSLDKLWVKKISKSLGWNYAFSH